MEEIYAVVNWIFIDEKEIIVGITDSERWGWDIKDGYSGADARTIIYVTLILNGEKITNGELVNFFCSRYEPLRTLATATIPKLFEIAWEIEDLKMTQVEARDKFFGLKIQP
jgi:hypothetical protein